MSDIVRRIIGEDAITMQASDLTYKNLGDLIAVETNAAIYIGSVYSVSLFPNNVYITVERDGTEAKPIVRPDHTVYLAH